MKDIFKATSTLGVVPLNKIKFNDFQLFKEEKPENVKLIKIKIWWGTPCQNEISLTIKPPTLLGIQCTYKNIQTEKEITSEPHCGKLLSNDIIVKDDLSEGILKKNLVYMYLKTSYGIFGTGKKDDKYLLQIWTYYNGNKKNNQLTLDALSQENMTQIINVLNDNNDMNLTQINQ